MIAPVFVDTNILLYARDIREPVKQPRAAQWLDHLWREQLGRTSTQVLSEYYVNVTRKLKPGLPPEEAWDEVQALFAWNPQAIDADLLSRARMVERRHQLSWWDSLIVAAAQAQGCAILLTEDLNDSAVYGGVKVRNPFSLSVAEGAAEYSAATVVSRRTPRRGRPKRRAA
jgi:predicted nucleic acid-binding protein